MDNDLELTIVQGINYNVPNPKDVDTYVRFELPWPSAVRKLLIELSFHFPLVPYVFDFLLFFRRSPKKIEQT